MVDLDFIWKHCSFDDWDGHGAIEMSGAVMQTARDLFEKFPDQCNVAWAYFDVAPHSNGTMMFEWSLYDDLYFYLEFGLTEYSAFSRVGEDVIYYPSAGSNGPIADLPALFEHIRKFNKDHEALI